MHRKLSDATKTCIHCQRQVRQLKHRNLCWKCYENPSIRKHYPPTSCTTIGRTEDGDFNGGYQLAPTRLTSKPGSPERIQELSERVTLKVALWRPDDPGWDEVA